MSPEDPAHPLDRVDRVDLRMLALLQAEGRLAKLTLAEAVSLWPTATLARVQQLTRGGFILGQQA